MKPNDRAEPEEAAAPTYEDLPPGYDPAAFAFFSKYWTEKATRELFEWVRSTDEDYFRVWQDLCYGMYRRSVLDVKTRALCAIASFVAVSSLPHVRAHVTAALVAGATPEEIKEVILQQLVYGGAPRVHQALLAFQETLEAFKQGGFTALSSPRR